MITAKFLGTDCAFVQVMVSGHAGFADRGEDVVCAAVTSAVQLTANAVTEILRLPATVKVQGDAISIALPTCPSPEAVHFLQALHLHLELLAETYAGTIKVIVSEV